ncbi:hypothetical protein [uncultured Roseibium sp.]|uniref:hypothetical protein n=1 Tax=uncultured Roseibium sp. TaxID=1936171 RepID=UPI0026107F8D|nr:hypothetical protein [uncultured Roseibium sp.]
MARHPVLLAIVAHPYGVGFQRHLDQEFHFRTVSESDVKTFQKTVNVGGELNRRKERRRTGLCLQRNGTVVVSHDNEGETYVASYREV